MYLGVAVLLGALRPPALLAKMVATLDQINGGRVILGLGVGSRSEDFAAAEVPFEHRGSRLEETIQTLRLAWSGQPVKFKGRFYDVDVGPVGPRPLHQPRLPIWIGGGGTEWALRRIGRMADGYIASSSGGPAGFRTNWDKLVRYAEEAGRDPSDIAPGGLIYVCVDDDKARADSLAASYVRHYYGSGRPGTGGTITGLADDCLRGIEEYLKAGLEYPIIASPTADLAYLDRFLEQVLPRLDISS